MNNIHNIVFSTNNRSQTNTYQIFLSKNSHFYLNSKSTETRFVNMTVFVVTGLTGRRTTTIRADFRLALSQWESSLQINAVSHWLGANLESALPMMTRCSIRGVSALDKCLITNVKAHSILFCPKTELVHHYLNQCYYVINNTPQNEQDCNFAQIQVLLYIKVYGRYSLIGPRNVAPTKYWDICM